MKPIASLGFGLITGAFGYLAMRVAKLFDPQLAPYIGISCAIGYATVFAVGILEEHMVRIAQILRRENDTF